MTSYVSSGTLNSTNSAITKLQGLKCQKLLYLDRLYWSSGVCGLVHLWLLCVLYSGHPHSYYQKALLSNGVTSALRLHQRIPQFQLSREYMGRLFLEDSAHYLFYCLVFVTGPPVSSILACVEFVKTGRTMLCEVFWHGDEFQPDKHFHNWMKERENSERGFWVLFCVGVLDDRCSITETLMGEVTSKSWCVAGTAHGLIWGLRYTGVVCGSAMDVKSLQCHPKFDAMPD